ncbi:MAG TPA: immunoglobulin domain-containing protein [Verrucomicrobiae bacterium]
MKIRSINLALFLVPVISLIARVETRSVQESSVDSPVATDVSPATIELVNVSSRGAEPIEFRVNSSQPFNVFVESSADLKDWTYEGLWPPNTPLTFSNTNGPRSHRFYRAIDYTITVQGIVRDLQTGLPVEQAKVTFSNHMPSPLSDLFLHTDHTGTFQKTFAGDHPLRTITVEKSGYDKLTTKPLIQYSYDPIPGIPLWLAPSGYRPPNDDFHNRFALAGTNVSVATRTFAATSEPGHELDLLYDDYSENYRRNLWWSWTAPIDGAVRIELGPAEVSGQSGIAVYTGGSLPELVRVWDSGMDTYDDLHANHAFFVKKDVQYQIAFGTVWPAETGFTLRMVPPVPPTAYIYVDGSIRLVGENLFIRAGAYGTRPIRFQWQKNGADIPNATNATFWTSVMLGDAGAYSARVSNEVGTNISNSIHITVLEQMPMPLQLIQGTWTMETSQGPVLITFTGTEFTARRASDNTFAGGGHFTIDQWERRDRLRLILTYTQPAPDLVRYFVIGLTALDTGTYSETDPNQSSYPHHEEGAFTRLQQQ